MELGINYKQAEELVDKYITDPITRIHLRESEVIMRGLAKHFGEDEEKWGIIGFLHDLDWDITKTDNSKHCILVQDLLKNTGATEFLINTIASHGYGMEVIPDLQNKKRTSRIEHCLVAAETLTGLIYASALIQPEKKLEVVQLESLQRKFKNKGFASRVNRDLILECEKVGISLDAFLQIGLDSMKSISGELGL